MSSSARDLNPGSTRVTSDRYIQGKFLFLAITLVLSFAETLHADPTPDSYSRCTDYDHTPRLQPVGWKDGLREAAPCPAFPSFYERFSYESVLLCGSDLTDEAQEQLTERLTSASLRSPVQFWTALETQFPKSTGAAAEKEAVARSYACLIAYGIRTLPATADSRREATEMVADTLKSKSGKKLDLVTAIPAVLYRLRSFYEKHAFPAASGEGDLEQELQAAKAMSISPGPVSPPGGAASLSEKTVAELLEQLRARRAQLVQVEHTLACYQRYLQPPLRDTLEKSYGTELEIRTKRDELNRSQCEIAMLIATVPAPGSAGAQLAVRGSTTGAGESSATPAAAPAGSIEEAQSELEEAKISFEGAKVATTRRRDLYEQAVLHAQKVTSIKLPGSQPDRNLAELQRSAAQISNRARKELEKLEARAITNSQPPADSPLQPAPTGAAAASVNHQRLERELSGLSREIDSLQGRSQSAGTDEYAARSIKMEISRLRGKANRVLEQAEASGLRGPSLEAQSLIAEIDTIPIPGVRGPRATSIQAIQSGSTRHRPDPVSGSGASGSSSPGKEVTQSTAGSPIQGAQPIRGVSSGFAPVTSLPAKQIRGSDAPPNKDMPIEPGTPFGD